MIIFLIIIILLIIFFLFLDKKLYNPYKLYILIGNKGTGKTSYMTYLAYKYAKRGYKVYTNFGIFNQLSTNYWLDDYPPNSVLFVDECGIVHDNRSYKTFPPECGDFYKYQRKNKLIVYLSSQTVDIDKKIRDLADYHVLLRRVLPFVFPIYYKRINKLEKQIDTGGLEIIDTLTPVGFTGIKFSHIYCLNLLIKKYDTNYKIERKKG